MAERVAILPVESGLFALRYAAAGSSVAPRVFVRVSPSSESSVQLVAAPGREVGLLSRVGDSLVVVASSSSTLHVTLSTDAAEGGLDAKIRLEKLMSAGARPENAEALRTGEKAVGILQFDGAADVEGAAGMDGEEATDVAGPAVGQAFDGGGPLAFRCLAHVARRGDQVVASGDWIGGPTTPMRIEGLQLEWSPPPGLQIYYQVLVAGARGRWSAWVSENAFAGSRGRALSLAGVRFRLEGARAREFEIRAEAIILGSAIESEAGAAVEFVSRTGNDPLVGLKVSIVRRGRELSEEPAMNTGDKMGGSNSAALGVGDDVEAKRPGRVRIFNAPRADGGAPEARKSAKRA